MAGKIVADTLEHSTAGSVDTQYVVNGSAKAWVNGSDAAALNDSFSISSGTDNGTGDYSYALSNAFSSANFAQQSTSGSTSPTHSAVSNPDRITSSVLAIETSNNTANSDKKHHVTAHGDLA